MYELISYEKFRDTTGVKFFDITIPTSNVRDLVIHTGPAISPPDTASGDWQFYLHPHQEDNLLVVSGSRTFYLVNFDWEYPFQIVNLDTERGILQIPRGTFHRSVSSPQGSIVVNQAVRDPQGTVKSEFVVYDSSKIPRLSRLLTPIAPSLRG
jgi:hypothetical protein